MHELFAENMRAYVVGQSHLEAGNHLEAFSIGAYVEGETTNLMGHAEDVTFEYLPDLSNQLNLLCDACSRQRIFGQTGYIIDQEDEKEHLVTKMKNLGLTDAPVFLEERKNDFNFGKQKNPQLVQFPLKLEALLPKPGFIDCARMHIDFPNLDERLESIQQENKGWFGSIWG